MSGVTQATFMNQRSFGPPAIGAAFGGGFFAGQISTTANSVATHNLVVGPLSSAQFTGAWKTVRNFTVGTSSVIDGPANTAAMIAAGAAAHPCGQFCNNLVLGGFSDWYMPAQNELEVCYFNLKPTTTANNTTSNPPAGLNPNAVPERASGYTSGTPAQTSAASFQTGGADAFTADFYWSSTEHNYFRAKGQIFSNGDQGGTRYKDSLHPVRAIRRVPV